MGKTNDMDFDNNTSKRIIKLRNRYLDTVAYISIQRAWFFTEKWEETANSHMSVQERVALCMNHVFEHMSHYIDPDDGIAGNWTEYFLGIPIDIERGLFNDIFTVELKKSSLFFAQIVSNLKFLFYFVKTQGVSRFIQNIRKSLMAGVATPSLGMRTINKRKVNPYRIRRKDKKVLLNDLLPYWKEKSVCANTIKTLEDEHVFAGETKHFLDSMPTSSSSGIVLLSPNAAIGTWQGHIVLDNTTVLRKGIITMQKEVQKELENKSLKKEQRQFLRSLVIAYEGVLIYARRLKEALENRIETEADEEKKNNYRKMLEAVKKVPAYPAETLCEAVQAYWIIKTVVGLSIPFNAHGMGRLDQIFYPYYKKDIDSNRMTREEARELFEELLIKSMGHNMRPYSNYMSDFVHRFDGSEGVTLGGVTRDGKDATNDLTYLILEAAYHSKTVMNVAVRLHKQSPEALYMMISRLYYHKISNISVMNDDICIKALMNYGYTLEDARDYAVISCADICTAGKSGAQGVSSVLLCNILDTTLRNGSNNTLLGSIDNVGPKTGKPESFRTFEDFLDAFKSQTRYALQLVAKGAEIRDNVYARQLPAPFISAFTPDTLKSKKDVTAGGATYNTEYILLMNSIANVIDSLYVIKRLVYDRPHFSLEKLIQAIDNNFIGYEDMYRCINKLEGKWGNGEPDVDRFAGDISRFLFESINTFKNFRNGQFVPGIVSMTTHTIAGRLGIATPDGRKAARPYAASCSPYNVEKCGPTGVLRSVSALDLQYVLNCSVNIRFHSSAIGKNNEVRKKWISLLRTYFDLGGIQLQPTVASTDELRAAQREPEQYRDLIVKVGGYSVYFTELGRELQEEIISRTEFSRV
jgi:pyruvate-formate lyase